MKKILIFISGIGVGIILTLGSILILNKITEKNKNKLPEGMTIFKTRGKCLSKEPIKVFQVPYTGMALANERSNRQCNCYNGKVVAVVNLNEGESYYDDQVIEPKTCFKLVGTFKYQAKSGNWKTVPVVIAE